MTQVITLLLNSRFLPDAMQGLGIALLTLFISLVVYLLQDVREGGLPWDRIVILEKVIRAKEVFASIFLVFVPLFLWHILALRAFLFSVFVAGVWLILKILIDSYHWLRTLNSDSADDRDYRSRLRKEYLTESGDWHEKEKIWSMTWGSKIESTVAERNLIKTFFKHLEIQIDNGDYDYASRYIRGFSEHLEQRTLIDWVIFGDSFQKILDLNYASHQKRLGDSEVQSRMSYDEYILDSTLMKLVDKYTLAAVQKGPAYLFFEYLEKHVKDKEVSYLKRLFLHSICRQFFANVADSNEQYDIWGDTYGRGYFPASWKTTKATFLDRDNHVAHIWLDQFMHWAQSRIQRSDTEEKFDKQLDEAASSLFPSVDPHVWSWILTLLMRPWSGNRMKALIDGSTSFGIVGRIFSGDYGSWEKMHEHHIQAVREQEEDTFELAKLMFPGEFTKKKIEGHLDELRSFSYDDNEHRENRRKWLISLFERMVSKDPQKPSKESKA